MAQKDYVVSDQDGASFLVDINEVLQAIATGNSGTTEPADTYAGMIWLDTTTSTIKRRNQANNAWVILGDLDEEYMGLLPRAGGNMTGAINEAAFSVAAHATTCDIWTGGNSCTLTGSAVTFTDVADAPQAGAVRRVHCNAAHVFTDNSNMDVAGGTFTAEAGDWMLFEAVTTSTFKVTPFKADGTAVVGVEGFASEAEYETGTDTTKALNSAVARAKNVIKGTSQSAFGLASVDFTGLPSYITNLVIQLSGISMNSTQVFGIQIGDSGGLETTGYAGTAARLAGGNSVENNSTGSFVVNTSVAANVHSGNIHLTRLAGSETWVASGVVAADGGAYIIMTAGNKTLSAALDRFSLIAASGTFDAGSVNYIAW